MAATEYKGSVVVSFVLRSHRVKKYKNIFIEKLQILFFFFKSINILINKKNGLTKNEQHDLYHMYHHTTDIHELY